MAYLQSIRAQTAIFLETVGFGFLLGAVYDLLRLVRLLTGSRRIAAWDVGFGALAGVLTFLFALTQNGGKVRVYLLAAIGAGFCIWYFCAGAPIRAATNAILRAGRRAGAWLRRPFDRLSARLCVTREKVGASFEKVRKKVLKKSKFLLKSCLVMVYNNKR